VCPYIKILIIMNYNKYEWAILSAASVMAGIVNGLIGTGGGIILYFSLKLLPKLNKKNNKQPPDAIKDIMANTIAVVVPMSVVSVIAYMIRGEILYGELALYLPAAVIGGLSGAALLNKLKPNIIKKIFAAMIIYAGVQMLLK